MYIGKLASYLSKIANKYEKKVIKKNKLLYSYQE